MEEIKKVHLVVSKELQRNLKSIKIYPRETFGDVIERLIQEHKKGVSPDLSKGKTESYPEPKVSIMKTPDGNEFHILS